MYHVFVRSIKTFQKSFVMNEFFLFVSRRMLLCMLDMKSFLKIYLFFTILMMIIQFYENHYYYVIYICKNSFRKFLKEKMSIVRLYVLFCSIQIHFFDICTHDIIRKRNFFYYYIELY